LNIKNQTPHSVTKLPVIHSFHSLFAYNFKYHCYSWNELGC